MKKVCVSWVVFITAVGGLIASYNWAVISGVLLFLQKDFTLTTFMKQQVVSFLLLGALVGVLLTGFLSDLIGRKWTMIILCLFLAAGNIVICTSHSFSIMLLGRLIAGVGVGGACVVIPLYLSEISPPKYRGAIIATFQLAITFGVLISYYVNYLLAQSENWRVAFLIAVILALAQAVLLLTIFESPSWLLLHGKDEKARALFKGLLKTDKIEGHVKSVTGAFNQSKKSSVLALFSKKGAKPLVIGVLLSVFQQITGINAIIYYGPIIFKMAGLSSNSAALLATLGIGIINVVATIVALKFIDTVGRRQLLLVGLMGMLVTLLVLGISFLGQSTLVHVLSVICLMLYIVFFAISLGPIVYVVIAEIYPLKFRGKAMALATFMNWLSNYLVATTFLSLVHGIGEGQTFILFGVISIIAFFFVLKMVPETKGKSLEEIQRELKIK